MPLDETEWPFPEEGAPLDPQDPGAGVTEPVHYGPPSSEDSEGLVLEPHRDGDVRTNSQQAAGQQEVEKEEPATFDPRYREDFEGLLYLGRLTEQVTWIGHTFEIRTLVTDEVLEVGLLTRPYRESMGEVKAYQAAVVAACVVKVDGRPMPLPITDDALDTGLRNRFDYVRQHWFPPVLDYIYEQYLILEARTNEVLTAMGKASR